MAFAFHNSLSKRSFVISLQDSRSIEKSFAKGYAGAKLVSFGLSEERFHQSFFADKSASHALLVDVAINGRCLFKIEDLDVIGAAVAALEAKQMSEHPMYELLVHATEQIHTEGVCSFSVDVALSK